MPCGAAAAQVFEAAGITAVPDTEEEDVRAALTKVQLGEVDAALVYASDVQQRRRPTSRASRSPRPRRR